jgi:hypothetical protein
MTTRTQAAAGRSVRPAGSYVDLGKNPRGYCPNHSTGVKLPEDFVVTPLQYVD